MQQVHLFLPNLTMTSFYAYRNYILILSVFVLAEMFNWSSVGQSFMLISGLKSYENSLVMIARKTDFSEHPQVFFVCVVFFFLLSSKKGVINAVNREKKMKLCLWQPYYPSPVCTSMAFQQILEFTLIFTHVGQLKPFSELCHYFRINTHYRTVIPNPKNKTFFRKKK